MASRATLPCLAPFAHGPFMVGADGAMRPWEAASLRFTWRGRRCEVRLGPGRARISAVAGAIPYTAEGSRRRPTAIAAIKRLRADLPPGWRFELLPDHRVQIEEECELPFPVTAIGLVGALVAFALDLDTYLDLLASAGLVGGKVNT